MEDEVLLGALEPRAEHVKPRSATFLKTSPETPFVTPYLAPVALKPVTLAL